jgi:hypothetical protein
MKIFFARAASLILKLFFRSLTRLSQLEDLFARSHFLTKQKTAQRISHRTNKAPSTRVEARAEDLTPRPMVAAPMPELILTPHLRFSATPIRGSADARPIDAARARARRRYGQWTVSQAADHDPTDLPARSRVLAESEGGGRRTRRPSSFFTKWEDNSDDCYLEI